VSGTAVLTGGESPIIPRAGAEEPSPPARSIILSADDFSCDIVGESKLLLALSPDHTATNLVIDAKDAALLAAKLLAAASASFLESGKTAADLNKSGGTWTSVSPLAIALGPDPRHRTTHATLIARFGEAELGLTFDIENLQPLANALLALAAQPGPSGRPQ
jgi:hypothetical protein